MPTRGGVDAFLDVGIMRSRRRRSRDYRRENGVKVGREGMAAWVKIDGRFYRVFHANTPITKRHFSAARYENQVLKKGLCSL